MKSNRKEEVRGQSVIKTKGKIKRGQREKRGDGN